MSNHALDYLLVTCLIDSVYKSLVVETRPERKAEKSPPGFRFIENVFYMEYHRPRLMRGFFTFSIPNILFKNF